MTTAPDPAHADARAAMGPVRLADYDARWPEYFEAERRALVALPESPLIEIEHFGSTAVAGLRAKPVIDIIAAVPSLGDGDRFAAQWEALGYKLIDVGFTKRRFFHKAPSDARGVGFHLHVIAQAAWANKNERLLRDWLIFHPDAARTYQAVKEELALRFENDREAYTEGKSEFLRAAVNEARRHAGLAPETVWWAE